MWIARGFNRVAGNLSVNHLENLTSRPAAYDIHQDCGAVPLSIAPLPLMHP
jgi:hypothetical protein